MNEIPGKYTFSKRFWDGVNRFMPSKLPAYKPPLMERIKNYFKDNK